MKDQKYFKTCNGIELLTKWSDRRTSPKAPTEYQKNSRKAKKAASDLFTHLVFEKGEKPIDGTDFADEMPYTSSSGFGCIWLVNNQARKLGTDLYLKGIAISADGYPVIFWEHMEDGEESGEKWEIVKPITEREELKNKAVQLYLTYSERTHENHRSRYIIHYNLWYLAEFETKDQLSFFMRTMRIKKKLIERRFGAPYGLFEQYKLNAKYIDISFMSLDEIPNIAKPFKALSNGSIVTCYFLNKKGYLYIFRPNPNIKNIYKPLPVAEHIAHHKIYGTY